MSTTKKTIKFDNNSDSLKLDPFKVFWESNDTMEKLFIAIHDDSAEIDELGIIQVAKSFSSEVNNKTVPLTFTVDQVITQRVAKLSDQRIAIYQFSLGYSTFRVGENSITLYDETKSPPDKKSPIGRINFFLKEESNVTNVKLERPGMDPTADEALWNAIDNSNLKYSDYNDFIDAIICSDNALADKHNRQFDRKSAKNRSPFIKSDEYNLIKFATDFYMLAKFGLDTTQLSNYFRNSGNKLPYYDIIIGKVKEDKTIAKILENNFNANQSEEECEERAYDRIFNPIMIELIWSYWMEQGMLVQTLNVINLRFQNMKGNSYIDRLMRFDTDPLRPLSHILWGYIQDEQHRLSLPRRLNEYDHEYGLTLIGKAVPRINPVDSRVKFLETFHSLLSQCTIYFRESDDTTRIADAFPILNSLKEVHLLLAEGNHNAYGNLTWTARQEMMMQQYILSRPEMREFLGGRTMVPYPEIWMDRVDTMRNIQGWGGTGIVNYYELAVHGELILLSIRYGNWSDVRLNRNNAANWGQRFRNSIQRYIHAYRSVTGVDLSVDQIIKLPNTFAIQPAYLIQQRLMQDANRIKRA